MVMRKIISLALAIGMLGAAFLAFAVPASAAETPDGQITTNENDGTVQNLFFWNDNIYFQVEYKIGSTFAGAPIDVRVRDIGGNAVGMYWDGGWVHGYDWMTIWTNASGGAKPGFYDSWWNNVYFETDDTWGWNPDMEEGNTYYIEARQHNTSVILFTSPLMILDEGIVITPDQAQYVPGQTVNINVTVDWSGRINVNLSKWMGTAESINTSWINQTLVDYSWDVDWVIPDSAEIGLYTIWVNETWPNWQDDIIDDDFLIGHYTMNGITDKDVYLPGEDATISWIARNVLDNSIADVDLDFDMRYVEGISGDDDWINTTTPIVDSPFTVALPSQADISEDIDVNATVSSGNKSANIWLNNFIVLGELAANVQTDKNDYRPGEVVIVTVETWAEDGMMWSATENASVTFALYDADGNLMPVNITSVTTESSGYAEVVFTIPADFEADDDYMIVATASKLGYSTVTSDTFDVDQLIELTVLTDKNEYTNGESIQVDLKILNNGVQVVPDSTEYWLYFEDSEITTPHVLTTSNASAFAMTVPAGQWGDALVFVTIVIDDVTITESSNWLWISPIYISVGASKETYYAGDTVTFSVLVAGNSAGFSIRYDIWDADGSPVQNGVLLLEDNAAEFTLEIPADAPSDEYDVRVLADNSAGAVVEDWIEITWMADYLISMKMLTGPAYADGAYAPGQVVKVSFEITKMSSELPNITLYEAGVWLEFYMGAFISNGQSAAFTGMSGELTITLPKELTSGFYAIGVWTELTDDAIEMINVNANGGSMASNVGGGMSLTDMMLAIMMVVVILILLWQIIKGKAAVAGAGAASKPAEPKAKEETYKPESSVKCPSCGAMVEVATSKRPIEVMCPKCGTSQMIN